MAYSEVFEMVSVEEASWTYDGVLIHVRSDKVVVQFDNQPGVEIERA